MAIIRAVELGLAAGAVGTVALTIAEKAEMAATGRKPSTVPGRVAAKLSARDPETHPEVVERLNAIVHWAHGIGLGAVRGLLAVAGMKAARRKSSARADMEIGSADASGIDAAGPRSERRGVQAGLVPVSG